ncbi:hypothetical protein QQF64_007259 [Cirrhinus molitorella]|uniref:Uncharacterized protein n=1 Tax=Cirrhinus molitorella TaxID=172907 RepID=A0ABR3MA54_9TELE
MDGSVGLLWEEWAKAGETMERKRYGGIGDEVVRVHFSRASQRQPRSALTLHKASITPSFRRANRLPFSRHHAHIRGNEGNHSSQMSKQAISITATSNLSRTIQSGHFFKLENRKIVLTFRRTEPHVHTRT